MQAIALRRFLLIAGWVVSTQALAGVGGTSAGVTTNGPNQGTEASADVKAQSAGFVQQNQQLQDGAVSNGIAVPGSASGTNAGQGNAANGSAVGDPKQQPGNPDPANAKPTTPPPPPPTYVSVVKHLTPQISDTHNATEPVAIVPVPVVPTIQPPASSAQEKADPPSTPLAPMPVAAPRPAGNRARAHASEANAEKTTATDQPASIPAVIGGRGEAPDGFAFYAGLGIALLLLAVALTAYLRAQRDEAAIRPPGR